MTPGRDAVMSRITIAIIGVGTLLRAAALVELDASPDAYGYAVRASDWTPLDPWAASDREPLWIAWTKVISAPFDYSTVALQVMSFVASVAVLFAVRQLLTRWVGVAGQVSGVLVVAVHPLLVRDAALGIREPVVTLLVIALAIAVIDRRPVLVGTLVAVLVAVRWEVGLLCFALVLLAVLASRVRPSAILIAFALAATMMAPYLASNAEHHGDPLHHSNRHARYYRNIEDALRSGENPYELPRFRGEPLSWGDYYLEYLGPNESLERISRGTLLIAVSIATFDTDARSSTVQQIIGLFILVACAISLYQRQDQIAVASAIFGVGVILGYGALHAWAELRLVSVAVLPLALSVAAGLDRMTDKPMLRASATERIRELRP